MSGQNCHYFQQPATAQPTQATPATTDPPARMFPHSLLQGFAASAVASASVSGDNGGDASNGSPATVASAADNKTPSLTADLLGNAVSEFFEILARVWVLLKTKKKQSEILKS